MGRPRKNKTGAAPDLITRLREQQKANLSSEHVLVSDASIVEADEQKVVESGKVVKGSKSVDNADLKNLQETIDRLAKELESLKALQGGSSEVKFVAVKEPEKPKFGSGGSKFIPNDDKNVDENGNVIPVMFFSIGRYRVVSVYMKEGSEVTAPYGKPIEFRGIGMELGRDGNAADTIYYCVYETWSKKEAEFLRNSPFYGYTIFDSITKAKGIKPEIVNLINKATNYIMGLEQGQLLSMAKYYGYENDTVSQMRHKLIQITLQEYIDQEKNYRDKALTNLVIGAEKARQEGYNKDKIDKAL